MHTLTLTIRNNDVTVYDTTGEIFRELRATGRLINGTSLTS